MKAAYIGIGSNLGDPEKNCFEAVDRIRRIPNSTVIALSNLYQTEPVGVEGHDWYINGVVSISTGISPKNLIEKLLTIEEDMGRIREMERWAPRIIDLDILLFGEEIIQIEKLTVPHPLMHKRRFVMAPLADMVPDLMHPSLGKSMLELLQAIPEDGQSVIPMGWQ